MRLFNASLFALVSSSLLLLACSDNFTGTTGGAGGGGGGGAGGAGGTGTGGEPCVVGDCPPGNECQQAVCTAGACGLESKADGTACGADGMLQCSGGACQGCTEDGQCSSALCANGVCCDSPCDGACVACTKDLTGAADGVCAPLLPDKPAPECDTLGGCGETPGFCKCEDGVKNGDESDVDCGGTCGGNCGDGSACQAAQDCLSALCADGVCCNDACDGACEACNLPIAPGLCTSIAPASVDGQCAGTQVCDGLGACALPAGDPCTQDSECASHLCKGMPVVCAACAADADCGGQRVCIGGSCFEKADAGGPCQEGKGCNSGFCVDGVCCESACQGVCMACHFNITVQPSGTCAPVVGPVQGFNAHYDPHGDCPAGPGGADSCSGAPADASGNSSCGGMP